MTDHDQPMNKLISLANQFTNHDEEFLSLVLGLSAAATGSTGANPAVAALLVCHRPNQDNTIMAYGITASGGRPHAEEILLQRLISSGHLTQQPTESGALPHYSWANDNKPTLAHLGVGNQFATANQMASKISTDAPLPATLYLSLEPCAHPAAHRHHPCAELIAALPVARVVVACRDPNPATMGKGLALLLASGKNVILAPEQWQKRALALHKGFALHFQSPRRPLVAAKIALSQDNQTALNQTSMAQPTPDSYFTTGQLRLFAQYLRCRYDALLVSAQTIIDDNPQLTIRAHALPVQSRPRLVLDPRHQLTGKERLFATIAAQPVIICTGPTPSAAIPAAASQLTSAVDTQGRLQWLPLLEEISNRGINRLLIETSGPLASSLLAEDLLDELWLCRGQITLGNRARSNPTRIDALNHLLIAKEKMTTIANWHFPDSGDATCHQPQNPHISAV